MVVVARVSAATILVTNEFVIVSSAHSRWRIGPGAPQIVGVDAFGNWLCCQRDAQTVVIGVIWSYRATLSPYSSSSLA